VQKRNVELEEELNYVKSCLADEMETRVRVEAELYLLNETNRLLKVEIDKAMRRGDYFENAGYRYAEGIRNTSIAIKTLRDSPTFREDGFF
jgi:transcription elongation GreA/GreB family factor